MHVTWANWLGFMARAMGQKLRAITKFMEVEGILGKSLNPEMFPKIRNDKRCFFLFLNVRTHPKKRIGFLIQLLCDFPLDFR